MLMSPGKLIVADLQYTYLSIVAILFVSIAFIIHIAQIYQSNIYYYNAFFILIRKFIRHSDNNLAIFVIIFAELTEKK